MKRLCAILLATLLLLFTISCSYTNQDFDNNDEDGTSVQQKEIDIEEEPATVHATIIETTAEKPKTTTKKSSTTEKATTTITTTKRPTITKTTTVKPTTTTTTTEKPTTTTTATEKPATTTTATEEPATTTTATEEPATTTTTTEKPTIKFEWISPVSATADGYTVWGDTWYTGPPNLAIDGSRTTAWTYENLGRITFDLGNEKTIAAINLYFGGHVSNGNVANIYIDNKLIVANHVMTFDNTFELNPVNGRFLTYETIASPHNEYLQIATWSEVSEFLVLVESKSN